MFYANAESEKKNIHKFTVNSLKLEKPGTFKNNDNNFIYTCSDMQLCMHLVQKKLFVTVDQQCKYDSQVITDLHYKINIRWCVDYFQTP